MKLNQLARAIDHRIRSWTHRVHDWVGLPFQYLLQRTDIGRWICHNTEPSHWTMIRFPLALVIAILLRVGYDLAAILVYVVSVLTDRMDGELARLMNKCSDFGELLDTIADSILQSAVLLSLANRYPSLWPEHRYLTLPVLAVGLEIVRLIGGLTLHVIPWMADRQQASRPNMSGKIKMVAMVFSVLAILSHHRPLAQQLMVTSIVLSVYSMFRHLFDAVTAQRPALVEQQRRYRK